MRKTFTRLPLVLAPMAWLMACGTESTERLLAPAADLSVAGQFSDWSTPVNLGPPVNTSLGEFNAFLSKDGLSLYFACDARCPGFGGFDIWVSGRASETDPWGPPENLGPTINTAFNDHVPTLSPDGHRLYFASDRPGLGANDIYVSRRHDKRDDLGWQAPVDLGDQVNTAANEVPTSLFDEDESGTLTLYIASNRPGGMGDDDIYTVTMGFDETWGPVVSVQELNTPFRDTGPFIRRDGLELFMASNRPGTAGPSDVWVSTRPSTSDPWSDPVNLQVVNSAVLDARPALSFDGTALYFNSTRPGGAGAFDLWVSTRSKVRGPD